MHLLIWAPDFEAVEYINGRLAKVQNLASDGRPMLKMSARDVARTAWDADERCVVIPAHVWTPWYGMYGSKSGFDSAEECFGDAANRIPAIETGLSSDPAMNWRVPDVDSRSIVSFSDAHSPRNMGRELTVFPRRTRLHVTRRRGSKRGHRRDGRVSPGAWEVPPRRPSKMRGPVRTRWRRATPNSTCPVCRKPLTLGVLNRVNALAARPDSTKRVDDGLVRGPNGRPPFRSLVPLRELLSFSLSVGPATKTVDRHYEALVNEFAGELNVLTSAAVDDLDRISGPRLAQAVSAVREGRVDVEPGYDGVYGTVTPIVE